MMMQVHSWDHAYAASAPQPQYQPSYTGQQASQGWNWGSQPTQHYPYPANTGKAPFDTLCVLTFSL